jgi:hypothetical protein
MRLTREMLASTVASGQDEAAVRAEALATDYTALEPEESAIRIARVLLFRWPGWKPEFPDFRNRTDTYYERWIDEHRDKRMDLWSALIQWITGVRGPYVNYPLFLLNRGFGRTREVMRALLEHEAPPPAYLPLLFFQLFRQALGRSFTEIRRVTEAPFGEAAGWFHELMTTDAVDRWLATKRQPIRFYAGHTNTVLNLYDPLCNAPRTGFERFAVDAEARYDFGGGFNTSEIERIAGRPFVSADLRSPRPRDYDGDLVVRIWEAERTRSVVADDATRDAFLARQERVAYLPFDVFHDHFPPDARSYAIFSSGFLTSTVPPARAPKEVRQAGLGPMSTSVHGLVRVVELVALGKPVDLFTIQRASGRVYKYKTCLLQWRAGKLVELITTNDVRNRQRWSNETFRAMRAAIAPDNAAFAALIPPRADDPAPRSAP